jgi:prepilin-type processing-associated H-X9-DG protein
VDNQVNKTTNAAQIAFTTTGNGQVRGWNANDWPNASPKSTTSRLGAKHSDGGTFLFCDGHSKWLKEPPRPCAAWKPGSTTVDVWSVATCP